ncbi:ead/Ea22-like family protein [Klebsiella pneumoniae]|nr:ead/Ea22-like family protein [Klebsiella pneumoniae]ELT5797166.1 ead/Ea22-like family protein [Klebsiella pneumoniae]
MTDITELAQRMKAAAVRAKTATEEYASGHMSISVCYAECEEFNRLTDGPDNIIALVEALEKAQQRIDELENDEVRQRLANAEHQLYMAELAKNNLRASRKAQFRKRKAAEQRIAELESRTVKLPDLRQIVSGDRYVWSDGVYNYSQDVKVALADAGIKVEAE